MEASQIDYSQIIIETLNKLFSGLFSSIDNSIYSMLDHITFISENIFEDKLLKSILNPFSGIIIIANSLLVGFVIYYCFRLMLSYYSGNGIEKPNQFLVKAIICAICINYSLFFCTEIIKINNLISDSFCQLGYNICKKEISFNTLILETNNFINLENINYEIEKLQNEINNKKIRSHTLELDQKNIEPKLDNLSKIEEELVNNNEKMSTLNKLNLSFELAKEILAESYEEMRNTVTPKFTQELSKNISEITEKKYSKIMFNDEQGLIVELESGNYVPASKLSIGTIDQLYLSLRLSMIDELSEENLPIILDEAFAYYDTERLTNILKYLDEKYKTHQIILFTCTNREKEILEKIKVPYNLIEL